MKTYIIKNYLPKGFIAHGNYPMIATWEKVAHLRPFMSIHYRGEYKRPWVVRHVTVWFSDFKVHYKTLANAVRGAEQWGKEFEQVCGIPRKP